MRKEGGRECLSPEAEDGEKDCRVKKIAGEGREDNDRVREV